MSLSFPSLDSENREIAKLVMRFAKTVIIGTPPDHTSTIAVNTASVTLVQLDAGPMAITCKHVVDEALTLTPSGQPKIFQIGDALIDLQSQLLDQSNDLDIATILLREDQLPLILSNGDDSGIGSSLFRPSSWPPVPPTEGEVIAFGGFPGTFRKAHGFDEIIFGPFANTASLVDSSSDRQFISRFERKYWVRVFGNPNLMDTKTLGGMSGGPVFISRGFHYDLIGIVKEYQDSYDAMCFASLKWVQSAGHISPVSA